MTCQQLVSRMDLLGRFLWGQWIWGVTQRDSQPSEVELGFHSRDDGVDRFWPTCGESDAKADGFSSVLLIVRIIFQLACLSVLFSLLCCGCRNLFCDDTSTLKGFEVLSECSCLFQWLLSIQMLFFRLLKGWLWSKCGMRVVGVQMLQLSIGLVGGALKL